MTKYNKQDLHIAANNTYNVLGHLITVLKNFDSNLGGPDNELQEFVSNCRELEDVLDYIMELSKD